MSSQSRFGDGGPPAWLLHGAGAVAVTLVLLPAAWVLASLVARASLGSDVVRAAGAGLLGSAQVCGLAALVGVPLGVATGARLAARPSGRIERLAGVAVDALTGVPGVVVGVTVYGLLAQPMGRLASLSSAAALSLLVFPRVARDTADLFRRVPVGAHEAATSLGSGSLRVTWLLLGRTLRRGLVGSATLALVGAFGEVAPILFTSVPRREGTWDGPLPPLAIEAFQAVHAADATAEGRAAALCVLLAVVTVPFGVLGRRLARGLA